MSAVMPTYAPSEISFESGEGVYLFSDNGKKYLDFGSGIAVTSVGHSHPKLIKAITDQASKVLHYSNLYKIPGQERLAQRLVDQSFASTLFSCNSGAEAVECGIKVVRKYHSENGSPKKYKIISCTESFHGRTIATLSAAQNGKHMNGFLPMLEGFEQAAFGDVDNIKKLITDETAAILVEPIQGEGGINTADAKYFRELRNIADEYGILLFMDEVQTGIGRTGKLFAHQWFDIKPDVVAIAKGLGGGFPIGGCLANKRVSAAMSPGTHGSTYGGNPLASAAANAVLDIVLEDGFMDHVRTMGSYLQSQLNMIGRKYDFLGKVKGRGLLIGINCEPEIINTDIVRLAENNGLLLVPAGNNVIRVIPPLIVSQKEIDEALSIFDHVCDSLRN